MKELGRYKAELVALSMIGGAYSRWLRELLSIFGNPEAVWDAILSGEAARGIPAGKAARLKSEARALSPERELERVRRSGVELVALGERRYPGLLAEIHDPPVVLFVRGAIPVETDRFVAVVGSRRASPYGKEVSRRISAELARAGVTVVSGAAYGIDSAAHSGALEGGGPTIAVLGNGVDVAYPRSNRPLLEKIATGGGCLLSEYPPGTTPKKHHFPARNRIIAGVSRAVLVVEAANGSGALLTAGFALEEGREVMAVPGDVLRETSAGTNALIRSGAAAATCAADVIEELGLGDMPLTFGEKDRGSLPELTPDERKVFDALPTPGKLFAPGDVAVDSGVPVGRVLAVISRLEVSGVVRRTPSGLTRT